MEKKRIYHIIEWAVALAACGYLVWRLATYDDYAGLAASLRAMDGRHYLALALCVALMPLNMTLEAWRWKTLLPMTWRDAHLQVHYSKLAGLITPWRLGEYPARALLRNEWAQTLAMGAVGSATMTAAIVLAGLPALAALGVTDSMDGLAGLNTPSYWCLVAATLIGLGVALYFAPRLLRRWATVSHRLVAVSLAQSFVRLLCWCLQLALVLWALGTILHFPFSILHLFLYYLLVTLTPNVPIAEVGVRGAWAILLFGTPGAALAGVLLWAVNTLLPCLVWPFLRKNAK